MRDRTFLTIAGGLLAIIFLLALSAVHASWTEGETVRVETEQQAAKRINNQEAQGSIGPEIGKPSPSANGKAAEKKAETGEDASEFWPSIFGFRFKVTDSLLVLFTGLLAWSTYGLQRSTVGLQRAADDQAKITNNLFSVDQRPWISVRLTSLNAAEFDQDYNLRLYLRVVVKNIGKTPAFYAGNGIATHIGYEGAEEHFGGMRSFCERQSYSKGRTIFPGEDVSWDATIHVSPGDIEKSRAIVEGSSMQFVTVAYQYRSGFSDDPLETVMMYLFGLGQPYTALPQPPLQNTEAAVALHLWKELVT